jgi:excinuclease ABC subunit C
MKLFKGGFRKIAEYVELLSRSKRIPHAPGVYIMKDDEGRVIYVGKARNLCKRVTSYFMKQDHADSWKTERLMRRVSDIDFVLTDNEIEAFLLESNLIKRYRPMFNIELKDQQRYTYLKITDESFPRLLVARRNRKGEFYGPKGKVYGPFVRGSSRFLTVGLLRKLFKVRICEKLPKRPCLEYFIKNCDAPCIGNIEQREYIKNVLELQNILEGKNSIEDFVNQMEDEMKKAAETRHYEIAKDIRDTLHRLNNLRVKQKMERAVNRNREEEYIGIIKDADREIAHVMTLRRSKGVICDRKKFEFELVCDNTLSTFVLQYCSTLPIIPRFVYVNEEPDSRDALEASLEKIAGHKVSIIKLSKDTHITEKSQLMDLVLRNLGLYLKKNYAPAIEELKGALHLSETPSVIDCFDVSNFGNTIAVGACSRFIDARPNKSGYRKFKIKKIFSQNDYAMIDEIITRRYSARSTLQQSNENDPTPDLIVVDGGKGQLNTATLTLGRLGLNIPCISLAKENEQVYSAYSSQPLNLSKSSSSLKLLQHMRDEAHRFGLAYNTHLRRIN